MCQCWMLHMDAGRGGEGEQAATARCRSSDARVGVLDAVWLGVGVPVPVWLGVGVPVPVVVAVLDGVMDAVCEPVPVPLGVRVPV